MNRKNYEGIGPDRWQKIKDSAWGYGIDIPEDAGTSTSFGVRLHWEWNKHRHTLHIVIVESGLLPVPEALNFVDTIIQAA